MQSVDVPQVNFEVAASAVGILMAVAVLVGIAIAFFRASAWQRLGIAIASMIGLLFLSMIGVSSTTVTRIEHASSSSRPLTMKELANVNKVNDSTVLPTSEAAASETVTSPTLPEWTQQPTSTAGSSTLAVVRSGRFASRDEAEQHAFDEAVKAAANHFRKFDPRGLATTSDSQRELIRQSAIRSRHDEISRHDFGTMKDHPMHQVWLRLELSPTLGDQFSQPWRHEAVEARLRTIASWGIWFTAATAAISIGLRLDSASNGERRRSICFATVFIVVSSLAIVA